MKLKMRWLPTLTFCCAALGNLEAGPAKNVILFLGDAGGISTLNAAGVYAHDQPLSLFIQSMPQVALSETSSLDSWVTDSAAGMTAIVTGRKTNNGMLSQLPGSDGERLKTILEYAEEAGLATGIVTNMAVWDATPAACYAHVTSRTSTTDVFTQMLTPRFGDGVDVVIGADRKKLFETVSKTGVDPEAALGKAGYRFFETPAAIDPNANRVASIFDGADFEPIPVVDRVLQILGRNPKGFFLMVEWDMHTNNLKKGLDRALVMDELVRHVAGKVASDTLILFTADHSFALQLRAARKSSPLAAQMGPPATPVLPAKPAISVENSHTGEEVVVVAQGPGSERVHGFMSNTRIFEIMMTALGLTETR